MHLPTQIQDLAMILGVAAVVTFAFHKIRQPIVLGYILAGIIVGPYTPTGFTIADPINVKVWAELGVIFLMFSLGLEFTFHKLARVGTTAAGTALIEVVLMVLIGLGAGHFLRWSYTDSLFLGGILSISSTTIIIKAFEELGVKSHRYAEIVFGILIVEDLVAVLLLFALSTLVATHSLLSMGLVLSTLKLLLVVGGWFVLGYFLIPSFLRYAGKFLHNETLTILSTALCLFLVVVATHFDYSAALGAFIMGSILAETHEVARIETLIHPLKDLFAAVFFVSVGTLVDPIVLMENAGTILVLTSVTLVGKFLTSFLGSLVTGQPLKRSIQIGASLTQIGEFSFIIAALGSTLNVTSDFLYPIAVSISVVTTFATPYFVRFSTPLAEKLEKCLPTSLNLRLSSYSAWVLNPRQTGEKIPKRTLFRFFINAIMVSLVFVGVSTFALPKLTQVFQSQHWLVPIAWAASIVLSAPFVWGMFFAFRLDSKTKGSVRRFEVYSFLGQIATAALLGALSFAFFPFGSLVFTLAGMGFLFFMFFRRLEKSYLWFENRFMANLNPTEKNKSTILSPWDVHTVRLFVHQNSSLVGKSIIESEIRKKFGLNIVAIQRGLKVLPSPKASEILFPHDELLVLGSDEQIESFKSLVELPSEEIGPAKSLSEYFLKRLVVSRHSEMVGSSIEEARIRDLLQGLIVGLERSGSRTINPEPSTILKAGDLLWIVRSG